MPLLTLHSLFARVTSFWSDATLLLVALQTALVICGILYLDFNITVVEALCAVGTAALTELVFSRYFKKTAWFVPKSALAAGLGLALFFRATSPWYFVAAAFIAIASKYLVKDGDRHIFNPSNFGIVAMVLLFPSAATVELTQWGHSPMVYVGVALLSFALAYRAGVAITTGSFLLSYLVLLVPAMLLHAERFASHHLGVLGPSLVLFASFMITDPRTAPKGTYARIIHGMSVALLYFTLEALGVRYAIFLSSFLVSLLNLASSRLTPKLTGISPAWRLPNAITLVCGLLFCAASFAHLPPQPSGTLSLRELSPSFIFFGVESAGVRMCSTGPLFARAPWPEPGSVTTGAAWGDFDNDGWDDLFVSAQGTLPSRLYRNNGGTFSDVTAQAGLPLEPADAALFVDYDNSGKLSLLVARATSNGGTLSLYRNNGNDMFSDNTARAGLSGVMLGQGAVFLSAADYDNNGYLDLLATTLGQDQETLYSLPRALSKQLRDPYFGNSSRTLVCGTAQVQSVLDKNPGNFTALSLNGPHPCLFYASKLDLFAGAPDASATEGPLLLAHLISPGKATLLQNHRGAFAELTGFSAMVENVRKETGPIPAENHRAGFSIVTGRFFQPLSFDYDKDGLVDILLTSDMGSDVLLKNEGNFVFKDVSADAGITYRADGMGADSADWNKDGLPDLATANIAQTGLYQQETDGTFSNRYAELDVGRLLTGWGVAFLDYNLDGWDDILLAGGASENLSAWSGKSALIRPLFSTLALYRNHSGSFIERTGTDICPQVADGKTVAVSDYNNDGSPDFFLGTQSGNNALYRNAVPAAHYLKVRLQGTRSNRMGIGAIISITTPQGTQQKQLLLGQSFAGQNSATLLFGLGSSTSATIDIRWPSGTKTSTQASADQTVLIRE